MAIGAEPADVVLSTALTRAGGSRVEELGSGAVAQLAGGVIHAAAGLFGSMHEMSVALEVGRLVEERLKPSARAGCFGSPCKSAMTPGWSRAAWSSVSRQCSPIRRSPACVNMAQVDGDVLRLDYLEVDDGRPDN